MDCDFYWRRKSFALIADRRYVRHFVSFSLLAQPLPCPFYQLQCYQQIVK